WFHWPLSSLLLKAFLQLQKRGAYRYYRSMAHFGGGDFHELTQFADRSFTVNSNCNGCGQCSRICPVENIEIREGKPKWLHKCENCFSCFQWCPMQAIGGPFTEQVRRFHHPEVTIKEILNDDSV
ncbi:MAG: EFR1 family ferrodoxin, partial [Spirochaetales bacterium]|nr:EFR1 family ferrodoxin [Spirochaetales bacterium]